MRPAEVTKVIATLGVALLLTSSDVCLLVTCAPVQAGGLEHCLANGTCASGQGAAAGNHGSAAGHPDDAAANCVRPCCLSFTIAPVPQLAPPAATAAVTTLPALAPTVAPAPAPAPSFEAPAEPGVSPPAPSFLDATGVRAPPLA